MFNSPEFWITLVGSVTGSSVLTALITAKAGKTKGNADAAESMAISAKTLVETMRIDIQSLKTEMMSLRGENLILQKRVYELEAELRFYRTPPGPPSATVSVTNS